MDFRVLTAIREEVDGHGVAIFEIDVLEVNGGSECQIADVAQESRQDGDIGSLSVDAA